ncbi:HET-domain-containing protein, partial [Cryphonectria parasitica EP155]
NHPDCNNTLDSFTPTRLINVGQVDSILVRLEAGNRTAGLPYVALSHCWGPPDPRKPMLVTETSTLCERLEGIPLDIMPQNFKDAVAFTRQLNIQYLWIDSLCIIQDSDKDWQREALLMDQVYKHAYLTLAATCARTSHDGFLKRPLSRESNIECSTWNTRGWTMQERYLSRRLVHCSQYQAYFECRTAIWPEDNHKVQHMPTAGRLFDRWFLIAAQFSPRQLTYSRDKLPALSGLAKETYSAGPVGRYLAGIWEGDLVYGLLWICWEDDTQFLRPSSYRAPSWTWACLDGQISWGMYWDRAEMPKMIDLLEVDIELEGDNPFGAIKSGSLVISGSLAAVS